MDLYKAVLQKVAERYEKEKDSESEIHLIPNEGNTGGHCEKRGFKKDKLYKIIFPTALPSPENYIIVLDHYEGNNRFFLRRKEIE